MKKEPNLKIVKPDFRPFSQSLNEVYRKAKKEKLKEMLIIGYDQNNEMHLFSSGVKRNDALWLLEWAKDSVKWE